MTFEVNILGSSGALPAHFRHPTAQVINHNDNYFLLDCGEGTQMQLDKFGLKRSKIDHIFISHLHGDHYFGLMGLITSYILLARKQPLYIYAPQGLKAIIAAHIDITDPDIGFEINITELIEPETGICSLVIENEVLEVYYFPLDHRITCFGYLFNEKLRSPNIIKSKIGEYTLTVAEIIQLKQGKDIVRGGEVLKNKNFTNPPPSPLQYAFCTDTLPVTKNYGFLQEVDLLYHEATFLHNDEERAAKTHHTTAKQAAEVAKQLNAKQLLIGHFSAKYQNLNMLLEEAKETFENTQLAIEGLVFKVAN